MRPPLKQLMLVELVGTLLLFAIPCLVFPPGWFAWLGLDLGGSVAALVFVRLLGGAFAALCVGYALFLLRPAENHTRIVAVASNGIIGAILWILIFRGTLAPLPFIGKALLTLTAIAAVVLALVFLIATARPPQPPGLAAALARRPGAEPTADSPAKAGTAALQPETPSPT